MGMHIWGLQEIPYSVGALQRHIKTGFHKKNWSIQTSIHYRNVKPDLYKLSADLKDRFYGLQKECSYILHLN
jgi:hypothetical protein